MVRSMTHVELLDAVWDAVPEDAEPERLDVRRAWLLERVAPGARVLDLGCGAGEFSGALHAHGAHPLGVDVVAEPLRRARARYPGLEFREVVLDGPLALDDNAFDVVWAGEVIEHVVDVVGWLSEVRRVLPSGGRLLLTTPDHPPALLRALADDPEAFVAHFNPRADHVRFFNAPMLLELLADLGFEDVDVQSDGETLFASAVRSRF